MLETDATTISGLLILMNLLSFKVERSKSGNSFPDEMSERQERRSFKKNKKLTGNTLAAVLEDFLGKEIAEVLDADGLVRPGSNWDLSPQ
jgi:hypothetical protein